MEMANGPAPMEMANGPAPVEMMGGSAPTEMMGGSAPAEMMGGAALAAVAKGGVMAEMSGKGLEDSGAALAPLVVAITGASGSGKTTFAERLRERLGHSAILISHDDYYKHCPEITDEEAILYDFDSLDALDNDLFIKHVDELKAGKPIEVPSYDFATHSRVDGARHAKPAPVILVEGLLIMADPALRELFDLVIYMDSDPDVRVLRRVQRDCLERGADIARAVKMYFGTTKAAQQKYVEPYKGMADLVIPDGSNGLALEMVAQGVLGLCGLRSR